MNEVPKNNPQISEQMEFMKPRLSPDGYGNVDYNGEYIPKNIDAAASDFETVSKEENKEQLELNLEVEKIKKELMDSGIEINEDVDDYEDQDDEKLSPYEELFGRKL